MINKLLFLFLIFSATAYSQEVSRSVLKGIVVSDSLEVENITVDNITSKDIVITDNKGYFSMPVRDRDTLVFSGISFKSSVLVITKTHLAEELLKIKLKVRVNELDELIVRPYTLTGNLENDTKNLKVKIVAMNLSDEAMNLSSEPEFNTADNALKRITPGTGNAYNGVDFVKLGKMAFKRKKQKEKKIEFVTEKNFVDAVKEKFSFQFFTKTLKISEEEIELFLQYCDSDPLESKILLNPKKEFELTDYLLKKSEEYLKKNR
nr:hypothetical protein [uncultured Flavobacterium sp.]